MLEDIDPRLSFFKIEFPLISFAVNAEKMIPAKVFYPFVTD